LAAGALDGALCIAVLHHIGSARRRARLLAELARVLAPGGRALVTVWASLQEEPGKLAKWQPIARPSAGKLLLVTKSHKERYCQGIQVGVDAAGWWAFSGCLHPSRKECMRMWMPNKKHSQTSYIR
jgi:SAM-dependent methyltransferase